MSQKSVLIGDDDLSMVEMLRDLLEVEGVAVEDATSIDKLIELAKAKPYDLILLDMGIPGLDETTPAQDLRARSGTNSKILILSGRDIAAEEQAGHLAGSQGAIQKGGGLDPIVAGVKKLLA